MKHQMITVNTAIKAAAEKVWECYNAPQHIVKWNQASPDWYCPASENDLKVGGRFKHTMAAKDGTVSFDFTGTYTNVIPNTLIAYKIDDGRSVTIRFSSDGNHTAIEEIFEAESENSVEMQRGGWQAILDNFKNYVEHI